MVIDPETFVKRVRAGESLAGLDLTEADPFILDLGGLDLRDADLSRAELPEATGSREWAVRLTDTTRRARRRVRVRGADLRGARLDRILGSRGDFRGAVLVGASLRSADLREANFELADVKGADFSGSNLEDARFHGAQSDESTVWPDGFRPV
ncbi:MAG: pentapeptide repeat-containing protein [Acidimicrobiia bacterium]|nr:pentapeptide repeat-containing protein [Acidimicrobiia bacterium]